MAYGPHAGARPTMVSALSVILGRKPSLYETQACQAVGWLESNYGQGWTGNMVGSNNWGAVQCTVNDIDCMPYQDSYSDGSTYPQEFNVYPTPEKGAEGLAKQVYGMRPKVLAAVQGSGASIFRFSYAMRFERYYGGFCPKAAAKYGSQAAKESFSHPFKNEGTRACTKECITAHANAIKGIIDAIALDCGDAKKLPLGTYDDAAEWYSGKGGSVAVPLFLGGLGLAIGWYLLS